MTEGTVEIGGRSIDYVAVAPDGFVLGDVAPVLLAFPPGEQDMGQARLIMEENYAAEALRLGWVVVSPAAPDGVKYFDGSEKHLPGLLDWVETWVTFEGGAPHVVGMSNGGISAFRFVGQHPDRALSLITIPGFPVSQGDRDALEGMVDLPIRMYVGAQDPSFLGPARETADMLDFLGADVELNVLPRQGHILTSTRDGVEIFEQLEGFRTP